MSHYNEYTKHIAIHLRNNVNFNKRTIEYHPPAIYLIDGRARDLFQYRVFLLCAGIPIIQPRLSCDHRILSR